MTRTLALFAAGALFSVGVGIAGMARPDRIIGFLSIGENWDPTLVFVMLGAVLTYALVFRLAMRRSNPVFAARFRVPTRRDLDLRLIGGSAIFGTGWGLAGFCPAPALAWLPTGAASAFVFVVAMIAGMWLFKHVDAWLATHKARKAREAVPERQPAAQS